MLNPDNLPLWLRENGRFCLWKYENRPGTDKPSKVPYDPLTRARADPSNPSTFGGLSDVLPLPDGFDGIGVGVFDGLAAVDLDNCINENGALSELAVTGLKTINSYAELSPSGKGLHILFRVSPDFQYDTEFYINNRQLGLECYVSGATSRFITLTGNTMTPGVDLEKRSNQLQRVLEKYMVRPKATETPTMTNRKPVALSDDGIIETAMKTPAFAQLWSGDITGYSSQSEADIALSNRLAFWTNGDPDRVDRLFRRSGLMREKWDELRGASTYGQITVTNAVSTLTQGYDPEEYRRQQALKAFSDGTAAAGSLIELKGTQLSLEIMRGAIRELGITVRYNTLLKELDVYGMPESCSKSNAASLLPVYLLDYLRACGIKGVTFQTIEQYLNYIADENRYNPVEEYLTAGCWDGVDRLPEIYRILGVESPLHRTLICKWLIQCVALSLNSEDNPIGADGVLVLQGGQGVGKTAFFRILSPFPKWFIEGVSIDLKDKDSIIRALGGWIAELGELDSTLKREQMALKAFITSTEDRIRVPYGKTMTKAPRRTSFCGTVNPEEYLRDETGSRRFWTVPVACIDKVALFRLPREFVNQLWYQVYALYQTNRNGFRLTDEEMKLLQNQNQGYEVPLPYEPEIREALTPTLPIEKWEWWSATEVKKLLFQDRGESRAIGRALAKVAGKSNSTQSTQYKKIVHGITQFLIPVQHYGGVRCIAGGSKPEDNTP